MNLPNISESERTALRKIGNRAGDKMISYGFKQIDTSTLTMTILALYDLGIVQIEMLEKKTMDYCDVYGHIPDENGLCVTCRESLEPGE